MKEALFWRQDADGCVVCGLCHHRCRIPAGNVGLCGVRKNEGGTLVALTYERCVAANPDPIEKKPLYHVLPGSRSYSVAAPGCNFRCTHCQNVGISQVPSRRTPLPGQTISPEEIVRGAVQNGCRSVAYTYTEPTVFFEYALDTARLAADRGLRNVFVTNGYITPEALDTIAPVLHAANIDLKAFTNETYKDLCGAELAPVLETIRHYRERGVWIELTTLVIPGVNDSDDELRALADFIADLSPDIPWHITRFHPAHRMSDIPPTPPETIRRAREIGDNAGLRFVYVGNIHLEDGGTTFCPKCGIPLLERGPFALRRSVLSNAKCPECNAQIPGVWES
mgnify:CR=1 FL=1